MKTKIMMAAKISSVQNKGTLRKSDREIFDLISGEELRQQNTLDLIPSENYVSRAVREACGSVLNNKYSEGYPGKRYYQGFEYIDQIEELAISRAKKLFGAQHANVQPNSGSPANQAVFMAAMQPGDTFMGLDLSHGGHLTHGSPVNLSGKFFNPVSYTVDEKTELIDLDKVRALAKKHKPKLIISGWTAYPRQFDFAAFQAIADEVGAYHLADISHIAGLVAGGAHPSPLPRADFVMTTTHKTLRGPRGAIILCQEKHAKAIDRAVFPGLQGGPHEHIIAGKAVALREAMSADFRRYAKQVVRNAKILAQTLMDEGIKLVSNGTDTHLILIDLRPQGTSLGRPVAAALERAGIVTNANTVPFDPASPFKPSGVRIGTPTVTTRGMKEEQMQLLGQWIAQIIRKPDDGGLQDNVAREVRQLCRLFPLE